MPRNPYRSKPILSSSDLDHLSIFEMISKEVSEKFKNDEEELFGEKTTCAQHLVCDVYLRRSCNDMIEKALI